MLRRLNIKEIYILSLIISLLMAIFSVGFFHPDEQYYAIDFAAFKTGILSTIDTWEYETELRPWALPLLFSPFVGIGKILDLSPFSISFSLRILSALFSFFAFYVFTKSCRRYFKTAEVYFYYLLFSQFAFFLKFFSVRTNSENWATSFFLLGFTFLVKEGRTERNVLKSILLLGLSFLMRHQMGFMVLGVGVHLLFIEKLKFSKWILIVALPIIGIFGLELAIDTWGYNHLSFSPYNYVYQNLILGKVNQFGTHPVWYYFTRSIKKIGPYGIFLFFSLAYFLKNKRKDLLLWTVFPFFIIHHLVSHKELRFLYPIAPLLLLMGFIWIEEKRALAKKGFDIFLNICFIFNFFLLLFVSFKPAYSPIGFYKALYDSNVRDLKFYSSEDRVEPRLELNFYLKKNLSLSKLEGGLLKGVGWIWTSKFRDLETLWGRNDCKIIYTTYPRWVLNINVGNWRERSNIWALSKCGN